MIDDYPFYVLCRNHPHKECDLCESCFEEIYNLKDYDEDGEPSDADMEHYVEEQMLDEELEADNL